MIAETTRTTPVRDLVLALALEHGISVEPDHMDQTGMAITRCSGDDATMDDVEIALVNLVRANHMTMADAQALLLDYLKERED